MGQSHQKLKKLTKVIHKNTDPSHFSHMKSLSGKQDEKKDKKKVKFTTPLNSHSVNKDKQVNIVQMTEEGLYGESENKGSETPLPEETSVSSGDSSKVKYFDLLSSSSEEYDSSGKSDNEE